MDCLGELKHKCSTGASLLERVNCNSIESVGGTGDISLKDVIATGEMYVKRSTGDVTFDCSDAEQITVKTSTGEVCGSLLTEKNFSVSTSTGEVEIPESTVGGKCEITTSTGDVNIFIAK